MQDQQIKLLEVNPECKVQVVDLFDGYRCVIVDDFLAQPSLLRAYGMAQSHLFSERNTNNYPGPELSLPPAAIESFDHWWKKQLAPVFGMLRSGASSRARLSVTTRKPEELTIRQRFCHVDRVWTKGLHDQIGIAGVLYLFSNPLLGGTAFYRRREDIISRKELFALYRDGCFEELAEKYPFFRDPPHYMVESNEFYERMAAVEPVFNRALFYEGSIFHSGDIKHPEFLTSDIRRGRLSANIFVDAMRA